MGKKQAFKPGEKVLFGIFGVFIFLAVSGYIVMETIRHHSEKPLFVIKTHYDLTHEGERGSAIFRKSGCTSCHRALRNGTNMGLSLDGNGSRRSLDWILAFLKNPEANYEAKTFDHGAPPKEAAYVSKLPEKDLHAIAVFLSELKADQGSASSPLPPAEKSTFIDSMVKMWAPKSWNEQFKDVRSETQQDLDEAKKE